MVCGEAGRCPGWHTKEEVNNKEYVVEVKPWA
jgi:hypothetical protein